MSFASLFAGGPHIALFSAASGPALADALRRGTESTDAGPARAVVFEPTAERLARAAAIAARGKPWRGRDDMWFASSGLVTGGGQIAFLFPGVDVAFEPRVDDLADRFGLPTPACTRPRDLQELGLGIIGVNRMLDRIVRTLGVAPDHVAGHSIGEWSGMIATGVVPDDEADRFIENLVPGSLEVPGVVFASAGCGVEVAEAALGGLDEITLSHDNCPHQVLLCGVEASVDVALDRLRGEGVLCQKLPFRSGFHSPLFAGYIEPHRENFARLPLRAPRGTLWSATTCAPYPEAPDAIRALAVDHLIQPVRFRELVEVLYARGARVFLQVGTGSLVHFVEDTLRGRPHMAIAANVKERTGIEQLQRVVAALFVEGAHPDVPRVPRTREPSARPGPALLPASKALLDDFEATLTAISDAQREVLASYVAAISAAPLETVTKREISVRTFPELADHALVRQPAGWHEIADTEPVVPMTMLVDLMREYAEALVPGRVAIELEEVRAHRWIAAAPPGSTEVTCKVEGPDRVRVVIGEHCEGTVIFADRYPTAPFPDHFPLASSARPSASARALYDEHWLFHGPDYQGIVDVSAIGADGIRGTIEVGAARGALLDNAGQLFGYWVMARHDRNRMAMPIRIAKIRLFGPHPAPRERLECTLRVRSIDDKSVTGEFSLSQKGRVWAVIEGWEKRRFETDARIWSMMQWPEENVLSEVRPEGFVVFEDRYRTGAIRERIVRRYLSTPERLEYERLTPRRQRSWLAGRIAAKDAVRTLLWRLGHGPLFPIEIGVFNDSSGRPHARTTTVRDVRISISHKDDIAVAMASEAGPVGIDIERILPREDSFAELSFTQEELRLVQGEPREEAWTRLWSAKEAAAKAAGTGLAGALRRFPIRDRAGERLLVGSTWVTTKRQGEFMIGWMQA